MKPVKWDYGTGEPNQVVEGTYLVEDTKEESREPKF